MNLAFILNNFYPFGGLEKNFLRIAHACLAQGHSVHVYTMSWQGERPQNMKITLLPGKGLSNHSRGRSFVAQWQREIFSENFDLIVGFNRMPGLDLYYAADVCYVKDMDERRTQLVRLTPRYRVYSEFERDVFSVRSKTHIMYLSEAERDNYIRVYHTPRERFHYLPPGIDKQKIRQGLNRVDRKELRQELGIYPGFMLLMVGSDFHRKGLGRSIAALAALPDNLREKTHLYVIGKGKPRHFLRKAAAMGVKNQVHVLGVRSDVPRFYACADILLHPAFAENTGNVILEAMVAGLPVLATENCGYGFHVQYADAGELVSSPFRQAQMNKQLSRMLDSGKLKELGENGSRYADQADLYSRPQVAVRIIEEMVELKKGGVSS